MVQIKQKSNKLIIAFILILGMLFECFFVHFEDIYAKENFDTDKLGKYGAAYVRIEKDKGFSEYYYQVENEGRYCCVASLSNPYLCSLVSLESFSWSCIENYTVSGNIKTASYSGQSYFASSLYRVSTGSIIDSSITNFQVSGSFLVFSNEQDAYNYLVNGEINNAIYTPVSYDKNVPTPKNLEVYFDRKLNKPFNLSELCNPLKIKWAIPEDSDYSEYTLDVQIDVNYNKLNSISGIGTKPTILQTGKVEFASCSATDKELNISSTYSGWTELSKKYQNSTWGLTGNYFDLWLRYKDSSGNYGNWVKVTINPDNSSTVVKAGLFDNGTNTTINKGYEEISGDSGEHVKGDYDNYYVDTVGDDVSNNLTSLKNNYSNLASFFKELFGFLPAEIWVLLIGLVGTMVIIAVVKFVRG